MRGRDTVRLALLVAIAATPGCSSGTGPEGGSASPPAVFESLWEGFDERYSFFVVKDVDWDEVGERWSEDIDDSTSDAELFDALAGMMEELRDGHLSLEGMGRTWRWTGWYDRFPDRFVQDLVENRYLDDLGATAHISYGRIHEAGGSDIGYVRIPSFSGPGWGAEIDPVLEALDGTAAIIVDIRGNVGGDDRNARTVASRFADRRRLFRVIRWRDGPERDDFGAPIDDFLDPDGPRRFDGPVALLTNRRVFSSAEGFTLMMRALPNVVTVGDTTGGGSANPEIRTLPNGWRYRVSRWLVSTPAGATFEGVGLGPDLPVLEEVGPTDPLLERAVEELRTRLSQNE